MMCKSMGMSCRIMDVEMSYIEIFQELIMTNKNLRVHDHIIISFSASSSQLMIDYVCM